MCIQSEQSSFKDELFHNVTVEDILFNGYSPGTLQFLLSIYDSLGDLANILPPLPDMLAGGKFGLWFGKNDTMVNQYYTINTGDKGTLDNSKEILD